MIHIRDLFEKSIKLIIKKELKSQKIIRKFYFLTINESFRPPIKDEI